MITHKKIGALNLLMLFVVSFRYGGQSLCDAGFHHKEGRAAPDPGKKGRSEQLILPVAVRASEQLREELRGQACWKKQKGEGS